MKQKPRTITQLFSYPYNLKVPGKVFRKVFLFATFAKSKGDVD